MATVTGNTLILKPSERDPGAAMIIAELCQRAGLPPGVINVVHGTVPTVNAICDHPSIKAISFVGGDRAGKHIYERQVFYSNLSVLTLTGACLQWDKKRQTGSIKYGCKEPCCTHARRYGLYDILSMRTYAHGQPIKTMPSTLLPARLLAVNSRALYGV